MMDAVGQMTNDSLISLTKQILKLEKEVEFLESILKKAYDVGRNDDCILCGLKDRIILKRIGGKSE